MASERLTDRKILTAKLRRGQDRRMLSDGGNLLLQITPAAGGGLNRSWIFRFERNGRRHDFGLGSYPDRTLQAARDKAQEYRRGLLDGVLPARQHDRRLAQRVQDARTMTFRQCAEGFIRDNEKKWSNAEHRRQWSSTLNNYIFPTLGDLPVASIDTPLVLKVVKPLWAEKTETASRVRGRIEAVLGWALVHHYRHGDNPARWHGLLEYALPTKTEINGTKHHAALPYAEVPALMVELSDRNHIAADALQFLILTAARAGEVLGAAWDEIKGDTWVVPAERMKAGREHRVPLSRRAVEIVAHNSTKANSCQEHGNGRLFPIGESAMGWHLKQLRPGVTVHGFRSSFRDWAAERTSFPREVAEMALAHAIPDAVEAAYRRGDLFEKRRRLMEAWASFCTCPVSATVVQLAT